MRLKNRDLRRMSVLLALAALQGCAEQRGEAPYAPSRDELQQLVVGNAASALDESGHFLLQASTLLPQEISQDRARALATAYITKAGYSFRRTLEKDRGGHVDLENLYQCGPVLYATSPFKPLASDVPLAYHRYFGSKWLVGFCGESGAMEVSVSVASLASELSIVDGGIDYSRSGGNEFFPMGVPPNWDAPVGLSPERAVTRMARRTGRRVSEPPALLAADPRAAYPQGAVWQIKLETPVELRGAKSGRIKEEETLYIGLHEDVGPAPRAVENDAKTLRIPTAEQPADRPFRYSYFPAGTGKAPSDKPITGTASLHRRLEAPITLESATPTGGN